MITLEYHRLAGQAVRTTVMYSRVRPNGEENRTPCQPSETCGPDTPSPNRNRPPLSRSRLAAVIAVSAGVRAGICITAEPTSILDVWAANQASTVGLSDPYASEAQTTENPRISACRASLQLPGAILRSDQIAEVEPEAHTSHRSGARAAGVAVKVSSMETRPVGVSGLQVSRLGLGTMTWGRDTSAEQARGLLETFCDAGGTLIDTAAAYGAGDSERLVGELVGRLGRREDVVIATKAGFRHSATASGSWTRHVEHCCAI